MPTPIVATPVSPALPAIGRAMIALAPFSARTMLLVEDSRLAAEAVRLYCRRAGVRLRRAETLAAAAMHLRVYRPDIAMIDLGLPDGSGLDLIAQLDRIRPRPARLVAVSGDPQLGTAAIRAGADMFLEKPYGGAGALERIFDLPVLAPAAPGSGGNAGGDPLALRDDLIRARGLLCDDGPAPERIGYAAQFLAGIARTLGDMALYEQALQARLSGRGTKLRQLVTERIETRRLI